MHLQRTRLVRIFVFVVWCVCQLIWWSVRRTSPYGAVVVHTPFVDELKPAATIVLSGKPSGVQRVPLRGRPARLLMLLRCRIRIFTPTAVVQRIAIHNPRPCRCCPSVFFCAVRRDNGRPSLTQWPFKFPAAAGFLRYICTTLDDTLQPCTGCF